MENQIVTIGPFVLVTILGIIGLIAYLIIKVIKKLQ